jgi:DNA-binding response OmpR family regulator
MIQKIETRIAVLENEDGLRNDLIEYLQLHWFSVEGFESAESLFCAYEDNYFDLAIIDIGLPGINGLQATQWLRSRSPIGIVILSALGNQSDQVVGLEMGADAYLVKNTSLELIAATCSSVLRRIGGIQTSDQSYAAESLPVGKHVWHLSYSEWALTLPTGDSILLTHAETLFLRCLLSQSGMPVSRADILNAMGKADTLSNMRNLDNCCSRLRHKILKQFGLEIPIHPSYGSGYSFTGEGDIVGE